ncbi:MAG: class B sortase [Clostridium sp.]|nr:class B sortase [Clostridium sp.]MCM1443879.1 class B sortase [Candidatus Amulumruptor caecigallinarius]
MNEVLILIKNNTIIFSTYTKTIEKQNLNNTNIINKKNLKFSEEYIIGNIELVSSFFNLVILKSNINSAVIKNIEIAETILTLLKYLPKITKVVFTEDKELNYTLSYLLLENINLISIECYNLPEIMFYKFPENIVQTRCEILFISDFMLYNNINTYSKLCNKDKIIIDSYLTRYDIDDIIYFFKKNTNLKKITIKGYKRNNLLSFLNMLQRNNHKNVTIIICEDFNTTNQIISDIPLFTRLNKKYKVNIKVKYSKEYKEKNGMKELNIILVRNIILIIIILVIVIVCLFNIKETKDNQNINVNLSIIESAIEEVKDLPQIDTFNVETNEQGYEEHNSYNSPYYTNYESTYNKLLELNSDTIGWLQVKNTKINYPVVQADNNDYYLNHAFDKTKNGAGWVFVDYRNNMDTISKNTIIYAHNIKKNNLMFGSLKNVLDDNWNSNSDNLKINFNIKGTTYYWQIFSIYTIDVTSDYLVTDFKNNSSFKQYIEKIVKRSIKDFNVKIGEEDKILTLSTCYNDLNYRLVVHAKMIGEN